MRDFSFQKIDMPAGEVIYSKKLHVDISGNGTQSQMNSCNLVVIGKTRLSISQYCCGHIYLRFFETLIRRNNFRLFLWSVWTIKQKLTFLFSVLLYYIEKLLKINNLLHVYVNWIISQNYFYNGFLEAFEKMWHYTKNLQCIHLIALSNKDKKKD